MLYNSKTSQPEAVVCLNFILRCLDHVHGTSLIYRKEPYLCVMSKCRPCSSCSAVEEAGTVFSIEQTRNDLTKDKLSVIEVEDSESEMSSSSSDLFHSLKDNPEDLLQLAPAPGDTIIPLTGEA